MTGLLVHHKSCYINSVRTFVTASLLLLILLLLYTIVNLWLIAGTHTSGIRYRNWKQTKWFQEYQGIYILVEYQGIYMFGQVTGYMYFLVEYPGIYIFGWVPGYMYFWLSTCVYIFLVKYLGICIFGRVPRYICFWSNTRVYVFLVEYMGICIFGHIPEHIFLVKYQGICFFGQTNQSLSWYLPKSWVLNSNLSKPTCSKDWHLCKNHDNLITS